MKIKLVLLVIIFFSNFNVFAVVDPKIAKEVKDYLNSLKSVSIDFEQIGNDGISVFGKLVIQKPYKFRCNYYPPHPILIIGNKNYISLYDYKLEQLTRIKPEENAFNFILLKDWDLKSQDVKITDTKITPEILIIEFLALNSEQVFSLILNRNPLSLYQMIVKQDSRIINIFFKDIKHITYAADELFLIKEPKFFGVPEWLTLEKIDKLIK